MEHDLLALLNSNVAPNERETVEIRRVISTIESMFPTPGDSQLGPFFYPQDFYRSFLGSLKNISSALRRFPPEMLSHIFIFCRDDAVDAGYSVAETDHTLMVLGQVCSRWRGISRGMPILWDILHLPTSAVKPHNIVFTRQLLDLSCHLPLSLRFSSPDKHQGTIQVDSTEGDEDGSSADVPVIAAVRQRLFVDFDWDTATQLAHNLTLTRPVSRELSLSIIGDVADRLKALTLDITSETLAEDSFPGDKTFPILSFLTLHIWDPDAYCIDFGEALEALQRAPSLQALSLAGGEPLESILTATFPWSQLTHLTMALPTDAYTARDILRRCDGLEKASFSELCDEEDENGDPTFQIAPMHICTLSNLRELSVISDDNDTICSPELFESMSLPSLRSLSIDSWDSWMRVLRNLNARLNFGSMLTHLCLQGINGGTDEIFEFLGQLEKLETLSIAYCADGFLEALRCHSESDSRPSVPELYLPALRELTLGRPMYCDSTLLELVDCLSHNVGDWDTPCPSLKVLHLTLSTRLLVTLRLATKSVDGFAKQLATKCAEGFKLVLTINES